MATAGCDSQMTTGPESPSATGETASQNAGQSQTNLAVKSSFTCADDPDIVVESGTNLANKVNDAKKGEVVAVDGMISIENRVFIQEASGITLTCNSPGSGIQIAKDIDSDPIFNSPRMITVITQNVTVENLVLRGVRDDGSKAFRIFGASTSDRLGVDGTNANGLTLRDNKIECPDARVKCVRIAGVKNPTLTGNTLSFPIASDNDVPPRAGTGFSFLPTTTEPGGYEIESRVENPVVSNNTLKAGAKTGGRAIRFVRTREIDVTGNTIQGPWRNGVFLVRVKEGNVAENRIDDAQKSGVELGVSAKTPKDLHPREGTVGVTFRANHISGIQSEEFPNLARDQTSGFFARKACSNVFKGNRVTNVDLKAFFISTTGNNRYLGDARPSDNRNEVVGGRNGPDGYVDCNGDGTDDPNFISGSQGGGGQPSGKGK